MTHATSTVTIHAPPDAIWRAISDFGDASRYLAMVVACRVAGEGIGALRTLTSADGSTVVERLDTLDAAAHRLSYALLTDTSFRHCTTTMALRDLGPRHAELEWSAAFDVDGLPPSEAAELMEGALAANCLALKQYMERCCD